MAMGIEVCRFIRNTIFSTSIKTLACLNRMTIKNIESDKSSFRALLETWVYSELLKMCTQQNEPWSIYYYRDIDQVKVDFIPENHAHKIIGIDVKASQTILNQDFRGLRKLAYLEELKNCQQKNPSVFLNILSTSIC